MRKVLTINFLIVVTFFIIIETGLRFFDIVGLQGYDKNFFISENNIVLNKPNAKMKVAGIQIKTDRNGFRIPLKNFNFKKKEKSILILGDSVSFGFGVKEDEIFTGILRKKTNYNLLNASVIGHNLKSYKVMMQKYFDQKEVKKIIIFICLNDIMINQGVISESELKKLNEIKEKDFFSKILKNDFLIKINFFLRDKSALYVFLKSLSTNSVKRGYTDYVEPSYENVLLVEQFSTHIKEIVNYSKTNNMNTEFVLLPFAHQLKKDCKSEYLTPQTKITNIFKKLNQQLNDFTSDFCQNQKDDLFLNYDPVHLSKAGHKLVSRLIIKNKLFEK